VAIASRSLGPVEILLVEDSLGDIRLVREALVSEHVRINLNVVRDGVEAMSYLRREGKCSAAARPDLILLDFNLPRKDGREVLAEAKADEDLKAIPVLVLTTSRSEQDVLAAYRLHANCFIVKPLDLHEFVAVLKAIEHFWFAVARLPDNDRNMY
jgi:chemotaxis family two-component system response regulator Rcp1